MEPELSHSAALSLSPSLPPSPLHHSPPLALTLRSLCTLPGLVRIVITSPGQWTASLRLKTASTTCVFLPVPPSPTSRRRLPSSSHILDVVLSLLPPPARPQRSPSFRPPAFRRFQLVRIIYSTLSYLTRKANFKQINPNFPVTQAIPDAEPAEVFEGASSFSPSLFSPCPFSTPIRLQCAMLTARSTHSQPQRTRHRFPPQS